MRSKMKQELSKIDKAEESRIVPYGVIQPDPADFPSVHSDLLEEKNDTTTGEKTFTASQPKTSCFKFAKDEYVSSGIDSDQSLLVVATKKKL
jgi:hypothetical protein